MIKSPTILTRRSVFRAGAGLAVAATATSFLDRVAMYGISIDIDVHCRMSSSAI